MVDRSSSLHRPAMSALMLCLAALFLPCAAQAVDPRPVGALIGACQTCHGPQGISGDPVIPNLAAQKVDYLARQLEAFRSGARKNDLMAAVAGQLGDAEIQALALFWSQLPPVPRAPAELVAPIRSRMGFPSGFPSGFTLYDSRANDREVVRRYANSPALDAARAGRALPVGSVIVVANHGSPTEPARSYSAMEVRAGWGVTVPELLRNGDWDYALFGADRIRRDSVNIAPCLACHKPIAADSHMFTLKALRAAGADAGLNTGTSAPR